MESSASQPIPAFHQALTEIIRVLPETRPSRLLELRFAQLFEHFEFPADHRSMGEDFEPSGNRKIAMQIAVTLA